MCATQSLPQFLTQATGNPKKGRNNWETIYHVSLGNMEWCYAGALTPNILQPPKTSAVLGVSAKHIIMGAETEEADAVAIFPSYKYVSHPLCTLTDAHLGKMDT